MVHPKSYYHEMTLQSHPSIKKQTKQNKTTDKKKGNVYTVNMAVRSGGAGGAVAPQKF